MKQKLKFITLGIITFFTIQVNAQSKNILKSCWERQVKPLENNYLTFSFSEKRNELEHSFKPWQETNYNSTGIVWCNADNFLKSDSLTFRGKKYNSKTQLDKSTLLFLDYGDKELFAVTESMYQNQIFNTVRYSPIYIINYFFQHKISANNESNSDFAVYKTKINKALVKLFIRKSDKLLDKITILIDDELFGDVLSTFSYNDYSTSKKLSYPKTILIEKINGKVKDEVKIAIAANIIKEVPQLLEQPIDYKLNEDEEIIPEIKVEKYSENIHFIELKHTDDRVMVVEFNDFLLVAEAPVNSENGELIISEAKKIAPNKPIKYFVFGHYHPHYLGGMRPFIHKGAKIICSKADQEYVTYLANVPHTLSPDSLQTEPKPLLIEEIKDSLSITDGEFEMKIYFIGEKSEHTNDYLIYYFPTEKLLFEDDLVWIANEGEIKKASGRQAGLYNAIMELGLNIDTIVQSWPVKDYGVKTVIPFTDLEKSMNIK
jgi:glyoxylase-like metal-dependent hydrolase (beta-lactamase superfamily II)